VLMRAPYRLSFAYAGSDRVWKSTWREERSLPVMIKLTVRDAASERVLALSTIASIHAQVPPDCMRPDGNCSDKDKDKDKDKTGDPGNVAMAGSSSGQGGRQQ
jgi:general secretion pathway protein J